MPISRNILLCPVCHSLFNDARQLRCGHSFCYACLVSQFDPVSKRLVCLRCKRIHQFDSLAHFETSLIVDAFLMTLVGEHRRKTAIPATPLLAFTLEQILQRSPTPLLVAKCAQCARRQELVVCPDCEQVICFECIAQHQLVVNDDVQQKWKTCKDTWNAIYDKSMLFDDKQFHFECQVQRLKARIEHRANVLLNLVDKWQAIYQRRLDHYSQLSHGIDHDLAGRFQSIDQRLEVFLNADEHDPSTAAQYLQEIKQFKRQLCQREKQLDEVGSIFPTYSSPELDSSLLGTIHLCLADQYNESSIDDDDEGSSLPVEEHPNSDDESTTSDDHLSVFMEDKAENDRKELSECDPSPSSLVLEAIPNKKLLWSLHFKFVPQYIVLYRQSILFASDRWGFVSTWTYTNARTKPTPKKSFVLFPQFRVGTWSRVYVESFSVYKPYICVFVKGSDESLMNFIAFFTHTGQLQMKVDYDHRFTLRQLICDESAKGNCIWTVDRGMHCIYKHDLPRTIKEIKPFLATHKATTRLNNRSCDVIRMAVNQHVLALLDSRTQIITLYNKSTQDEVDISSREFLSAGEHKLWRVEIFPDTSLLLRFDDDERTGDRSQTIHHIVVHVKRSEASGKYEPISQIQATNVYGFAIGSDFEVIIGLRKPNCFEGLIACYV